MPLHYRLVTSFLAIIGCVSLLTTGEMHPLMSMGGIAVIPGYYRFLKGRDAAPRWAIGVFSVFTLAVFLFDSVIVSRDVFAAVAHLTIAFQAIKSFDLREPWDHLQVYFMALLQLIIASEMTASLLFGFIFLLFMALLVTAMVISHFMKEGQLGKVGVGRPALVISSITLLITAVFFVTLPRFTYKFFGKSHTRGIRTAGFSGKVDFGSYGQVKLDPTVVMRVDLAPPVGPPYYWRGMALDHFDGTSWSNSNQSRSRLPKSGDEYAAGPYDRTSAVEQTVYLEPIDSDIIFGLASVKAVRSDSFYVESDWSQGYYLYRKAARRAVYTVASLVADSYQGLRNRRYLQMPEKSENIRQLALRVAGSGRTDTDKALMTEQYLRNNYTYSLSTSPPPKGVRPIDDFLFRSKQGYCEHFAASMVLMLRGLGVHARIVTGFAGGEKNEYGGYIIVRQSDAHSWVEALIDGRWRRFDPTPPGIAARPSPIDLFLDSVRMRWYRYVIGFSVSDQIGFLRALKEPFSESRAPGLKEVDIRTAALYAAALLAAGSLCFVIFRLAKRRRYGFATRRYMELRGLLRKRGEAILPTTTSGDIRSISAGLGAGDEIGEFLDIYEADRFGGREMDGDIRRRYDSLLRQIGKKMRRSGRNENKPG